MCCAVATPLSWTIQSHATARCLKPNAAGFDERAHLFAGGRKVLASQYSKDSACQNCLLIAFEEARIAVDSMWKPAPGEGRSQKAKAYRAFIRCAMLTQ